MEGEGEVEEERQEEEVCYCLESCCKDESEQCGLGLVRIVCRL